MTDDQIRHIFFPYVDDRYRTIADAQPMVYYTTAETAFHIIKNGELWMRSTSTMNDYLEVDHGYGCLSSAMTGQQGKALIAVLDGIFPGMPEQAVSDFHAWLPAVRKGTFIACVSEHLKEEDARGRLSMWRAYGGHAGVALVMNSGVLSLPGDLGIYASPVKYGAVPEIEAELARTTERITAHQELVRGLGPGAAKDILFNMFRFAVLCTKHPGFAEEREWRIITNPEMNKSPLLRQTIEVIRGVPQPIQRIKLNNLPEHQVSGLALDQLLQRIIVGPCAFPGAIYTALLDLLREAGVQHPEALVFQSDIPLRMPSA